MKKLKSPKANKYSFQEQLIIFWATFGYSGLLPKAPGTWGSLFTMLLAYLLINQLPFWFYALLLLLVIITGISVAEAYDHLHKTKDNKRIVIDETAGQMIALIPVYILGREQFCLYLSAFLLFRFFDVTKIFGIRRLEKFPGGLGVMLDDLLGGLYAAAVMMLIGGLIFK